MVSFNFSIILCRFISGLLATGDLRLPFWIAAGMALPFVTQGVLVALAVVLGSPVRSTAIAFATSAA